MADIGTLRLLFLTANLLFWFIGGGLLGFIGWTLSSLPNTSGFMSGSFLILYVGIVIGLIISLDGLLGCIGGMFGSMLLLKLYVGLSVLFGLVEICLIMAVYAQKGQIPSVLKSSWEQINDDAKHSIQKNVSCLSAMQTWLSDNMAIWIGVLVGIGLIQVVSGMLSCQIFTLLHERSRVKPLITLEKEEEKSQVSMRNSNGDVNDLEATSDRNIDIDGASCKSVSTPRDENHSKGAAGIVDIVNLDNEENDEDGSVKQDTLVGISDTNPEQFGSQNNLKDNHEKSSNIQEDCISNNTEATYDVEGTNDITEEDKKLDKGHVLTT